MTGSSRSSKSTPRAGSPLGTRSSTNPKLALPVSVAADERGIHLTFEDGRTITRPLTERLQAATPAQRSAGVISEFGMSLHWEDIDEDVDVGWFFDVHEDVYDDYAADRAGLSRYVPGQ